jgi:hypothetical protein
VVRAFQLIGTQVEIFDAQSGIAASVPWEAALAKAIESSEAMLILWTPHSLRASGQLIEIGAGWVLRKPLLPILYNCSLGELDPVILTRRQAIEWRDFIEAPVRHLDIAVRSGLGRIGSGTMDVG